MILAMLLNDVKFALLRQKGPKNISSNRIRCMLYFSNSRSTLSLCTHANVLLNFYAPANKTEHYVFGSSVWPSVGRPAVVCPSGRQCISRDSFIHSFIFV